MVEKLPDIYRDVIMMKYFYGFKVNEISKQLHLSVGGVKSRLEQARKILRKDMNDDERYTIRIKKACAFVLQRIK